MSIILEGLILDRENDVLKNYFLKEGDKELYSLQNLAQINILIGQNNSGKSLFLRTVFDELAKALNNQNNIFPYSWVDDLKSLIKRAIDEIERIYGGEISSGSSNYARFSELKEIKNDYIEKFSFVNFNILRKISDDFNKKLEDLARGKEEIRNIITNFNKQFLIYKLESPKEDINVMISYIPVLRGLRNFNTNNNKNNLFQDRIIKDYFLPFGVKYKEEKLFTGENLYNTVKELLLSEYKDRKKITDFEKFICQHFFSNQIVTLIPREIKKKDDGTIIDNYNFDLHIKIGSEKEQPIYNVGDGIQALILLTFPLFEHQDKKHLLFIEEPELYLHPGMQRIFIETIKQIPNTQIFMATHSNHFLDMTLEADSKISIYTFRKRIPEGDSEEKIPQFIIENVSNEKESVLDLIGVQNSSVFLSNCTIWVEGITDRFYIRKYLEVYQDSLPIGSKIYKEDLHFSFVEYGGGNITHWSFLESDDKDFSNINVERLCGKIFLISDQDGAGLDKNGKPVKNKQAKYERHLKLKETLKGVKGDIKFERYYCLECREIENLLSPDILVKTIENYDVNDADIISKNLIYEEYKQKPLGEFIESKLKKNNGRNRQGKYNENSGTITQKVDFAKKAISHINELSDLSEEARKLAKQLYEFIEKMNS
jgi:predicted ATP-dependent endonuclease of OLD family